MQDNVQRLKPQYARTAFIEFLCKPIDESKEPIREGSKLVKQLESVIEEKWTGILV